MTAKLKTFLKEYGRLGLGVYLGISALSIGSIYTTIYFGLDVQSLLEYLGKRSSGGHWDKAGTFAVTYAIHKIILPLRLFATVAVTRALARKYPQLVHKKSI